MARRTVHKMLGYSVPPGYQRKHPVSGPKLDIFLGVIDQILEEDKQQIRKQWHTERNRIHFDEHSRALRSLHRGCCDPIRVTYGHPLQYAHDGVSRYHQERSQSEDWFPLRKLWEACLVTLIGAALCSWGYLGFGYGRLTIQVGLPLTISGLMIFSVGIAAFLIWEGDRIMKSTS